MGHALFSILISIISIPPTGIVLGILTERFAKRANPFPFIVPARAWNSLSKIFSASLTIYSLLYLCPLEGGDEVESRILPIFLYTTRLVLLAACTKIGTSLQPVGLTGGIACGKSTVSEMLSKADAANDGKKEAFCIIDLDKIAHDVLDPTKLPKSDRAYEKVISAFGTDILANTTEGQNNNIPRPIDRRKLGEIIFADNAKRRKLNSITHPLITKIMLKRIILEGYSGKNIVLADVPLIYEAGWTMRALFGIIIVVATTPSIQLERLIKRNEDLTRKQCEERVASQMDITKKAKLADLVIWNNGSVGELEKEVERTRMEVLNRCRFIVGGGSIDYAFLIRVFGGIYGALWLFGFGGQ